MKKLPPHPSLEFYKKEAKQLVRAYRAQEAAAVDRVRQAHPRFEANTHQPQQFSRHDAQLVLAREHGFASWPKFKHQIDFRNLNFSDPQAAFAQFKLAVNTENTERLRLILEKNPVLADRINEPVFAFDAPAMVYRKKNREILQILLGAGADPNARSTWWAGGFGALDENDENAAWLIERGAKLDACSAASLGYLEELKRILEADPAAVNRRFGDGQTPLHVAQNCEVAGLLLEAGADLTLRDLDHRSTAAQYQVNRPEVCRLLLDYGAEPDIFLACRLGDFELVQKLVEEDPTWLKAKVGEGRFANEAPAAAHIYLWQLPGMETPPRVAHHFGHQEIYRWLVKHSTTAQQFVEACREADSEQAQGFLQQHPDLLGQLDGPDLRALPSAVWEKRQDAVKLMLELGWPVDTRGVHESTPLDRAAILGQAELIRLILSFGPDLNPVNEFGGTPLSACLWGKVNMPDPKGDYLMSLRLLLGAGCHPSQGASPEGWIELLREAIRMDQFEVAELVLPHCRDLNLQDEEGYTALDLALLQGADDLALLLRQKEAKTAEELNP